MRVRQTVWFFALILTGFLRTSIQAEGVPVVSYQDQLIAQARNERLSQAVEWLQLGHYRRGMWGWKSEQDAPEFFLSPGGKRDPEAELAATLRAFFDPASNDEEGASHAQCRFPARYAWLKSRLQFDPSHLPEQACPRFEAWRDRLSPSSATLVFASAYMSNPASMYGHTFLRLNRRGRPGSERLNDYCVNFAADSDTRNGIAFAIKGLIGGYRGKFSTLPYYMQVQRYNNLEARDLWEYDLALSQEALDQLVRHLWEMGRAYFKYFFLTKNCSYALLPLLEAADPSLQLSNRFRFKVIPVDTVRVVLESPGLVTRRRFRPAYRSTVLARRELLTVKERRTAEGIGKVTEAPPYYSLDPLPAARQALVLESGLDLFRHRRGFARFQSPADDAAERDILLRRGKVAVDPDRVPEPIVAQREPPESGHPTGRVAPGVGRGDGTLFYELSLRPALHDLLDPPAGYVPASRLEMFNPVLRYRDDRNHLYLQKLTLIDIQSYIPLDPWMRDASWKAFIGLDVAEDRGQRPESSLAFRGTYAKGVSVGRADPGGVLGYALGEGEFGAGPVFDEGFRTGVGGTGGLLWTPFRSARVWAEAGVWRYFWGDVDSVTRETLGLSLDVAKDVGLRAMFRRNGPLRETLFSLAFLF